MTFTDVTEPEQPGWELHLSADTTLMEMAAILGGIGGAVEVEFVSTGPIGARGALVRPRIFGAPKPTVEQIRDIMEHGLPKLPMLRIGKRQA
jgi:hypothetical protein